jgi:fumarylacetoacetate (FAA) hydrolase
VKLATLRTAKPDGNLVVVSRDLARMIRADDIAPTLQAALDAWADVAPRLEERARRLNEGEKSEVFDPRSAHSPLPRAYQGATAAFTKPTCFAWRNGATRR